MTKQLFCLFTTIICLARFTCVFASVSKEEIDKVISDAKKLVNNAILETTEISQKTHETKNAVDGLSAKRGYAIELAKKEAEKSIHPNALTKDVSDKLIESANEYTKYIREAYKKFAEGLKYYKPAEKILLDALEEISAEESVTPSDNDYTLMKQKIEEIVKKVSDATSKKESIKENIEKANEDIQKATKAADKVEVLQKHAKIITLVSLIKGDVSAAELNLKQCQRIENENHILINKMKSTVSKLSEEKKEKAELHVESSENAMNQISSKFSLCTQSVQKTREILQKSESTVASMEMETNIQNAESKVKEMQLNLESAKKERANGKTLVDSMGIFSQNIVNAKVKLMKECDVTEQQFNGEETSLKENSDAQVTKKSIQEPSLQDSKKKEEDTTQIVIQETPIHSNKTQDGKAEVQVEVKGNKEVTKSDSESVTTQVINGHENKEGEEVVKAPNRTVNTEAKKSEELDAVERNNKVIEGTKSKGNTEEEEKKETPKKESEAIAKETSIKINSPKMEKQEEQSEHKENTLSSANISVKEDISVNMKKEKIDDSNKGVTVSQNHNNVTLGDTSHTNEKDISVREGTENSVNGTMPKRESTSLPNTKETKSHELTSVTHGVQTDGTAQLSTKAETKKQNEQQEKETKVLPKINDETTNTTQLKSKSEVAKSEVNKKDQDENKLKEKEMNSTVLVTKTESKEVTKKEKMNNENEEVILNEKRTNEKVIQAFFDDRTEKSEEEVINKSVFGHSFIWNVLLIIIITTKI